MIDINVTDTIVDTIYFDENLQMNPMFAVRYVLDMDYSEDGKQRVLLSPPFYKYNGKQPRFDYVLADVVANCHVEKPRNGRFSWSDIKNADGKKVGLLFVDEPARGGTQYEVMFKDNTPTEELNPDIESDE